MFDLERWQEIFETLRKNKLRTFLTGLSVASGIFILVILLGFSKGIENGVKSQFEQDATNRISVWTGVTTKGYKGLNPGRYVQLKNSSFESVERKYDDYFEYRSKDYMIWGGTVTYKNESGNYRVRGTLPDNQFIENADIGYGRFVSQLDLDDKKKVAVIGNKMKKDLFKEEDPIDKNIQIFGVNFKVVGVFYDPGGDREESQVYIPVTTAQQVFNAGDNIRNMSFTVKMANNFDEAVAQSNAIAQGIEAQIKELHTVAPDDQSAVRVNNTLEEAQKIYSLIATIQAVFWFVGIGTIIAGIVGVGNIMLIIVKERTKEIGIRKALGALPMSIVSMILQEAVFVTIFAGLFGLIFGLGLLELVGPQIDSDFIKYPQVDFNIALTTVFILVIAGAFAGFIPAYRAAKIKPIIALRDE
ncbi:MULTISPECIES: ABC transporter permease [Flavobacteriaceae]|jgi:putative ABC transport system permease protein|uniref:ABC transporter permease n=1 Tax=Flavobacteriaceae TaxID=49546 RepID=UPI000C4E30C7|nr:MULTISPECIES: ABC transporter permease [Flavobacteriaceae]MAB47013.1 ABC transporter ATP-binding protein [Flavobacteriaceae bacterium]MBD11051.1 ABC transporter ATP-binding protein [Flavobacteriaceae bacterium]|tara:strand:+ start:39691 stop:40935 length:1245 start_codon:yes stop_codon:yes gene_type:complete